MHLINKIKLYLRKGLNEFFRKLIFYFFIMNIQTFANFLRSIRLSFYFKKLNIDCGKNITVYGYPFDIKVGSDLVIKENAVFEFSRDAKFHLGNYCFFSFGVLICCNKGIYIGDYVQIGEYTSIRDTTHNHAVLEIPIKNQGDYSEEIKIGNNVWIGRGCIILPGTVIEDGVVIGANSVVKGKLQKNCIYAGSPARLIKER